MTTFSIKERQTGNITILDLKGSIRIGDGSVSFRNATRQLLLERRCNIILNLNDVTHIDSSGLGEMISGYVALHKAGGKLKLLHLNQRVHELMTITKLLTVFDIYDNESDAVDSFSDDDSDFDKGQSPSTKEVHNKPGKNELWPKEPDLFKLFRTVLSGTRSMTLTLYI